MTMMLDFSGVGRRLNKNFISTPSQAINDSCCWRKGVMINTVTFAKISFPSWRDSFRLDSRAISTRHRVGCMDALGVGGTRPLFHY